MEKFWGKGLRRWLGVAAALTALPAYALPLARYGLLGHLDENPTLRQKYQLLDSQSFAEVLSSADQEALRHPELGPLLYGVLASTQFSIPLPKVLGFAEIAYQNNLDLWSYSPYIAKLQSYHIEPLEIVARAVKRQAYDRWAAERKAAVRREDPQQFVSKVKALEISPRYQERLVNTFSLCIDSYRHAENRRFMRKVTIEAPLTGYGEAPTETEERPVLLSYRDQPIYRAYFLLLTASKEVIAEQKLDEWQQLCLSKCIADEMVEYSPTSVHPLRAAKLFINSYMLDGAENLSSRYGVCTTYARITEAIAHELGFGGRVRIGHKGKHYFNQINIDGKWYHFHPLRKYGKDCSFFPYS